MRRSVPFWVFCGFVGYVLYQLPSPFSNFFVRNLTWYLTIRFCRRFFYPRLGWAAEWRVGRRADGEPWTAVVTGASTGIGAAAAGSLVRRGALVAWTARSTELCGQRQREVECDGTVREQGPLGPVVRLDLADLAAVRAAAEELRGHLRRLDALVLNAGYHGAKRSTVDGFEMTIGVNHLGHMYLTHLLMGELERCGGRVVVVASDLHRLSEPCRSGDMDFEAKPPSSDWTTYNHSKLANLLFVRELARRLKARGSSVKVVAVHPGTPVQSELMRNNGLGSNWLLREALMPLVHHLFCRSALEGGENLVRAALVPLGHAQSGAYFENFAEVAPAKTALDDEAARELWDESCKRLGIDKDWV